MAVSRALRRLLRIRDLEEEQGRTALESAVGDLSRLQQALASTTERDRLAGLEETRAADRMALALSPRIEEAEGGVAALREEYLARRVERRQAATLVDEAEARDALEIERRSQMALDDWFRNRLHGRGVEEKLRRRGDEVAERGENECGGDGREEVSAGGEKA